MNLLPTLWVYNYDFEFELAGIPAKPVFNGRSFRWFLLNRIASILIPFCAETDTILTYTELNPEIRKRLLYKLDFLPRFHPIAPEKETNSVFTDLMCCRDSKWYSSQFQLMPWGWSPLAVRYQRNNTQSAPSPVPFADVRMINSKRFSADIRRTVLVDGDDLFCSEVIDDRTLSREALQALLLTYYQKHGDYYVKHFWGTAGQLTDIVRTDEISKRQLKRWRTWIQTQKGCLVEKQISPIREWGLQAHIDMSGKLIPIALTRLYTASDGNYLYSIVNREDQNHIQAVSEEFKLVFQQLISSGYVGPIGIDLLETASGKKVLLEVNARLTMGRVAAEWYFKLPQFSTGLFGNIFFNSCKSHMLTETLAFFDDVSKTNPCDITVINFVSDPSDFHHLVTIFIGTNSSEEANTIFTRLKEGLKRG